MFRCVCALLPALLVILLQISPKPLQDGEGAKDLDYDDHALNVVNAARKGVEPLWNLMADYGEKYRQNPGNARIAFGYAFAVVTYAKLTIFPTGGAANLDPRKFKHGGKPGDPNTVMPSYQEIEGLIRNVIRKDPNSAWPYVLMVLSLKTGIPNSEVKVLMNRVVKKGTLPGGMPYEIVQQRTNGAQVVDRYIRQATQRDPFNPYVLFWQAVDERDAHKALQYVKQSWERGGKYLFPLECLAVEYQIYDKQGDTEKLGQTLKQIRHMIQEEIHSPVTRIFLYNAYGLGQWVGRKPGKQPWAITPEPKAK
ncbi:MAG: hypothetical protein KatS3mg023_2919 [Armatimonadota bacterium]|nr:MAG: hypothetical protein KatS3mg023_2919 [Armatimonadota bacterium]